MPSDGSFRIVLFPFPAQGHFSAFLSLAAHLHDAQPTADITIVSTPRNVEDLRRRSSSQTRYLRFHALPFAPAEHGLPGDIESTDAVPLLHFITLFEATESRSLQDSFDSFVRDLITDAGADGARVCVIADPFLAWTTDVARRRGAAHAIFVSCGAFGSVVFHSLWNHLPHLRAPGDDAFCLPDHPEVTVHRSQLPPYLLHADGTDRWSAHHRRQTSAGYDTDAILISTMEELETTGLRMLRKTMGVPVYPIGPLVRRRTEHSDHIGDHNDDDVKRWLDTREERPFIWAIRPPFGFDIETTNGREFSAEWLPEGFEERMRAKNIGLLIHGWAPQVSILAHASTGAFLSHCGWNSVLESMAHGVPIIAWPLTADQFFNAQMLEEWGACVEVSRGNWPDSPALERERVVEVVEMVMGITAKADKIRQSVKQIQGMIGRTLEDGGSSKTALEEFLKLHGHIMLMKC
ncbi:UDP-glycosyltransferase 92A1 isoform X2 [Oryza sativa Japonica Group]|uniref:UDP-glycosyltransferase 92A1 isoform X2 n=1 Tax=Oryza sativa subsp. japonica TaxID=39947 RepID=UPI0007755CB5|nr:UDP-glycosyltransferase 92A1 isoform X2 [Oryza sativa Japonica Group]KAF2933133.1 hypothetical protein DAI22_04g059100 [Oryza sativa Japonica Group]